MKLEPVLTTVLVLFYLMFVVVVTGLAGYPGLIVIIPMGFFIAAALGFIWDVYE